MHGPQTFGEISGRTERLYSFSSLEEVQETISSLEKKELVKNFPDYPSARNHDIHICWEENPLKQQIKT